MCIRDRGVFAETESGVGDADLTGRQEVPPKDSSVQASTSSGPFLPIPQARTRLQPSRRAL